MDKKKILIIEDNLDLQEILKINFESEGVEVLQSFDGIDGLIDMVKQKPDAVLLDLMMPRMDGYELLEILALRDDISIPIIICSNIKEDEYKKKMMAKKANLFIEKAKYDGASIVEQVLTFLEFFNPKYKD